MIRNLVSNALKFSPRGSVATLHAVFVPSNEAVVAVAAQSLFSTSSSVRQIGRHLSIRLRRSGSISAVVPSPPAADNAVTSRSTGPFTAGYLRISVTDHG